MKLDNKGRLSVETFIIVLAVLFASAAVLVVVLNQIVRPFTAKWHRLSIQGAFKTEATCTQFREELRDLQTELRKYSKMLADMAGVEDLTALEQ